MKGILDVLACLASPLACHYAAINSSIKAVQRAQYARRCAANGKKLFEKGEDIG